MEEERKLKERLKHEKRKVSSNNFSRIQTSLLSGAIAGACAKTCIAPLDRAKIIFQISSKEYSLLGAIKLLIKHAREDNITSLWRGNSATLTRIVPYAAIHFAAYEQLKYNLRTDDNQKFLPPLRQILAGSTAGAVATLFTYPLDIARARLAVTKKHVYSNLYRAVVSVARKEGVFNLWRGITPSLIGILPYAGTSFFTFETLKRLHFERKGTDASSLYKLLYGAIAGALGQTASYPLDIVRRRMQTAGLEVCSSPQGSMLRTLIYVVRYEGGVLGLYKGLSMNWIKGPISVTISFNVYELTKNYLTQTQYF
ncbi:hypothetical protein LOD99_7540 [Oopsacas minuta]|uniref:Solute carrier family 25 member 42 n=1 Tax=Oopsacas minuta TaxID=111878 RepID=A0AAV7JNF3_9METZ|nr:hypothetical protein LOD99_7540 [Oopsacas minuta]